MVRNLITLYPSNETSFTSNGLGSLADSESCIVKEEYNGAFELEMTYPITGAHYKDIEPRCIIYTKPNPIDPPQAFRIYQITKPMNGMISIYANHISYDLDGYPLEPFSSENCAGALQGFVTHSIIKHPFTFWTDKETLANFAVKTPMSIRSALGGTEGSILDVYGGVYKFDNFTVRLFQHRGSDRGVTIRYGKNLTDLNQEEEIANCYTEVMPYWYDQENDILLKLSENTVPVENHEFNFRRVLVLDVSSDFEEQPSEAQMRERAKQYIQDNQIWVPKVSLTVSYAQLSQSEEYKQYNMYERVEIDDTVNIEFQKLGITAHAKVVETNYNVKYGRYDSVTLGNAQSSMSSTFADQAEEFKQRVEQTKSDLQRSVDRATKWITNGRGYMVAVKDPEGNWMEICSLDTPNLDEAMNVWRWNNAGFGFSANGYNGEYRTAITQDGHIVADFIDTGTLTATLVKTGILQSKDGETFYLDLDRGILRMKATGLSIEGKTVEEIAQEKADAAQAYADQQIANYSNLVTNQFANVQSQLDGQIESYFRQYEPKMTNEPASEWDTDEKRQAHEGDIFYWEKEDGTSYAYRFMKDSTLGSWGWNLLQDTDITKAIADAAHAQDTADGKRRNFVITPYPPYDIGDQWTDSDTGEVYTCVTAKAKGGIYNREDWSKLNIYTDDTIANQALDEARKNKYLVMSLDNDYEGILTDPSGHYEGTLNAQTKVQVFWGTKDVSGDCEYVIIPSSGVKANWNLAIRTVTVTELTTDKGYVDITAKYNDDTFEVTKRFNVAKVKRGLDGATGKDGEDGADGTSYKIKVTSMHLSQTRLDQIASPEESHWPETFTLDTGVSENTTADLKVGDYVSLSVYNEDKDSIAYVQGKVVGISSVSVLTCNTYGYIDRGDAGKKTARLKCGKLSHTLAEWESYGTDGKESTWTISGYDNSSIAVGDNVFLVGSASDALDSTGNPINVMLYMTAKSISASSFVGIATALVMGYEGKQGEKGEQGEPGKQGEKGEQGTQGINLILNSTNSGHGYVWTPRNNGNSSDLYNFISFPIPELVKANTTYTASLYGIKITSGTFDSLSFILSIDGNTTVIRTDTSISGDRAVAKLTPSKDASYLLVYAGPAGSTRNNGMTAEKIKFEEGNVPNPVWTPAPQDLIGPQGPAGPQGVQGPKGTDGKTYYTWLKYASSPTTGMSDTPDGKSYIGLAYNKESSTESSNYGDYQWSLIKGEKGDQGVPGGKGADGKTLYTWIKYADDSKGTGISDSPTGKPYIGLAYNKDTSAESSDPSAYTWSLIQGEQGTQGINLFGFHKGSLFENSAIKDESINGIRISYGSTTAEYLARISNLGLEGRAGYYTVSFNAYTNKGTETIKIDLCDGKLVTYTITANEQRFIVKLDVPQTTMDGGAIYQKGFLDFAGRKSAADSTIYIKNLKIEYGSVDNPVWTPAPQDLIGPQGPAGAKGDKGDTGPSYQLKLSSNFITVNQRKKTVDKTKITASAYNIIGNTRTQAFVYWAYVYVNSGTTHTINSGGKAASILISGITSTWTQLTVTAYFDSARTQIFDTEDVEFLRDPLSLTAQETFDMLTDSGKIQGLFQDEDGNYYISFTYAKGGTLTLGDTSNARGALMVLDTNGEVVGIWNNNGIRISKGRIVSGNYNIGDDGHPTAGISIDVDAGNISTKGVSIFNTGNMYVRNTLQTQSGGRIAGFIFTTNRFYKMMEASTSNYGIGMSTSPNYYGLWLGETNTAGGNGLTDAPFKVLLSGSLYATNAHITGTITGSTITGSSFYTNSMPANIVIYKNYIRYRYITQETVIEEVPADWKPTGSAESEALLYTGPITLSEAGGLIGSMIIQTNKCFTVASTDGIIRIVVMQDTYNQSIAEPQTYIQRLYVPESITCGGIKCTGYVWAAGFVKDDGGDVILPASTASYGSVSGYSYATTTPYYGDIGEGDLDEEGLCYVYIDDVFSEMINTNQYMVFLQKEGPGDLWIKEKTKTYFVVEGTPLLHFSWELKAKKKSNEYLRLENVQNFNEAPKSQKASEAEQMYDHDQITLTDARIYNEDMKTDSDEAAKTLKELETNYDIEVNNLIKEREELL